jgi:hypothetical protein
MVYSSILFAQFTVEINPKYTFLFIFSTIATWQITLIA